MSGATYIHLARLNEIGQHEPGESRYSESDEINKGFHGGQGVFSVRAVQQERGVQGQRRAVQGAICESTG